MANPIIGGLSVLVFILMRVLLIPASITSDVDLEQDFVHEDNNDIFFLRITCDSFEVNSGDYYLSVKGQFHGALKFWNDIHMPQFILDVIECDYKLPLIQITSPSTARNNSSALEQSAFVGSAINDLIINGYVTESGKKRLILDLCHVNQFLYKCRFRGEDLSIT